MLILHTHHCNSSTTMANSNDSVASNILEKKKSCGISVCEYSSVRIGSELKSVDRCPSTKSMKTQNTFCVVRLDCEQSFDERKFST